MIYSTYKNENAMTPWLRRTRPGFSFIEILVAVTIMGIMISVVVGAFQYLGRAKVTATESNLQSLKTALQMHYNDVGAYPATLQDLLIKPMNASKQYKGPYLEQEVMDGWKHPFEYNLNPKGSKRPFELFSWGPNGEGSPEEEHLSVWA